ncbi:MAG: TonB-dependent receptor [Bacteroidetes bacterium]|nr:TonB-dependent receptor [Bacteroidota bacterium]
MKKIFLSLILFLALQLHTLGQQIQLLDATTRQALPFATVVRLQTGEARIAGSNGRLVFDGLTQADTLQFSMLGYATKKLSLKQLEERRYVVALRPVDIRLGEVVVSANRWASVAREVPQRISRISSAAIGLSQPQTAADLLGSGGEVFIQKSQQGGGSPMIRGFATNRLLIAVDGVRMNNAIFRGGNLQNVISIDPFSLQSAEVLFGPGSVMYGSDALGGVMLFNTLRPEIQDDEPHVNGAATARYASANNEKTFHMHLMAGGKKMASLTSFSMNDFGHLRMGRYCRDEYLKTYYIQRMDSVDRVVENPDPLVQIPSAYKQWNLLQKFLVPLTPNLELGYTLIHSTTSNYDRYDRLLRFRNNLPRSAVWYYGPQDWTMNLLSLQWSHSNKFFDDLKLNIARQDFAESRHDRDLNRNVLRHRWEKVTAWSSNADFRKLLAPNRTLVYGLEWIWNNVESTGEDVNIKTRKTTKALARYPMADWTSLGVYAQLSHRFNQQFLVQAGARYSHTLIDATFDQALSGLPFSKAELNKGALTGSAGLLFNPDSKTSLSFNLASGFRAPNVDDMGKIFDSEPGTVTVPNPALKPEYLYSAELGLARELGNRAKLDATAYYSYLDQAMVRRAFTLNGADSVIYNNEMSKVMAIQNAAFATVYGLQASLELKAGNGLSWRNSLVWQKGEEELDNGERSPLRHAAPLLYRSALSYRNQQTTIELYYIYNAEVSHENMPAEEISKDYMYAIDENGKPFSPVWYTLNIRLMHQINETFGISAGIENITDRRYRPYSSGLVAPGRNMVFALNMKF